MSQSVSSVSISDDDLYGSGTEDWNQNGSINGISSISPTYKIAPRNNLTSRIINQYQPICQVTKDSFSDEIPEQSADYTYRTDNMDQHGQCSSSALQFETGITRPCSGLDIDLCGNIPPKQVNTVTSPVSSVDYAQENLPAQSTAVNQAAASSIPIKPADQVVRAKVLKNIENESINSTNRKIPLHIVSPESINCSSVQNINQNVRRPSERSQSFEPMLQVMRYDNQMESEDTERKITNGVKQKKCILNINKAKSNVTSFNENAKSLNENQKGNIPLPANIDSASVMTVTEMRSPNLFKKPSDFNPECGRLLIHYTNSEDGETFRKNADNLNFRSIHNNLRNECSPVNKKAFQPSSNVTNNILHGDDDLEMDSDSHIDSTEVLKCNNKIPSSCLSDNWSLHAHADNVNKHLVHSYEPAINPQECVPGPSYAANNSPVTSATSSIMNPSHPFLGSLNSISNLESSILFGDGHSPCADDSILAQHLQKQCSQEHIKFAVQNQFDICRDDYYSQHNTQGTDNNYRELCQSGTVNQHDNNYHMETGFDTDMYGRPEKHDKSLPRIGFAPDMHACPESHHESLFSSFGTMGLHEESCPILVCDHESSADRDETKALELYHLSPRILAHRENDDSIHQTLPMLTVPVQPSESGMSACRSHVSSHLNEEHEHLPLEQELFEDDEAFTRQVQNQLNLDEEIARALQAEEQQQQQRYVSSSHHYRATSRRNFQDNYVHRGNYQPLHTRYGHQWNNRLPQAQHASSAAENVEDSRIQGVYDYEQQQTEQHHAVTDDEYAYLTGIRNLPMNEGFDIPPSNHYSLYQEYDPDYVQDEFAESRLVSINRDPYYLANLLMHRAPGMMIPNDVDLNDYEALWELAEHLGEVRRVGMEQSEISMLPVHIYQPLASDDLGNNKTNCSVCLSEYISGEQLRYLPCCHTFHVDCIDKWLKRNAVCPVCRQSAKPD